MNIGTHFIRNLLAAIVTLFFTSSSAFATGATVRFTAINPTEVPTLSGTMLIVLSLLLFVVAVKITRQKGSDAGKFFMFLIGTSALISGTGGIKLLSDAHAAGPSTTPIIVNYDHMVAGGGFSLFGNSSGQALNFNITADQTSRCGYQIYPTAPTMPGVPSNAAMQHSGQLPDTQFLYVYCMMNGGDISDSRLKQNVRFITKLNNGLKLYSFNYRAGFGLDNKTQFVGVMAQDLLSDYRYKDAVTVMDNDFYAVNYAALGLKMITLDEWQISASNIYKNLEKRQVKHSFK